MYHKNFLKEIDADVTGLMILHQECFLNLVEGGPDVVMALLRHVHKNVSSAAPTIGDVRVLASTEDCPSRAFVTWSFRSVKLLKSDTVPDMEADHPANLAYATYRKLVKLGKQLTEADLTHVRGTQRGAGVLEAARLFAKCTRACHPHEVLTTRARALPQADISAALDLLQQRYSSFIPAADLVKAFCSFEKLPDLDEYMSMFDSPVEVDLESDRTWPVPPPLSY